MENNDNPTEEEIQQRRVENCLNELRELAKKYKSATKGSSPYSAKGQTVSGLRFYDECEVAVSIKVREALLVGVPDHKIASPFGVRGAANVHWFLAFHSSNPKADGFQADFGPPWLLQ
jgi:hypothetical protein